MVKKIAAGLGILPAIVKVKAGKPIPLFCQWETTFRCNMNCVFCSIPQNSAKWSETTTAEALDIIDQLGEMGTKIMNFSGGEPFLRKDFFEMADRAKKNGMIVFVNTNGLLVEENIGGITRERFDFMRISIDGSKELHDRLRKCNGAFDAAFKAVELIKKKGIGCMINTVVTKDTKPGELSELLERAKGIGVKVSLTPAVPFQPCEENEGKAELDEEFENALIDVPGFMALLNEMKRQYPGTVDDLKSYWKILEKGGLEKFGCRVMDIAIGIKPDGRVSFPCTVFPAKMVKGRLKEVFYGEEAERQRRLQGRYSFCQNCFSRCGSFPTLILDFGSLFSMARNWGGF